MSRKGDEQVRNQRVVSVLAPKLAGHLQDFRLRLSALGAGFPDLTVWHPGTKATWGEFPDVPLQRATVYRGNAETWAYSHHHAIAKFGDRYVASWSNGPVHEDHVGQEVHYAWSENGLDWSEPRVLVHTPLESNHVRNNVGIYVRDGRLYCYVGVAEHFEREVIHVSMTTLDKAPLRLDVYETTDLQNWTCHEDINQNVYLFEGPRETRGGRLMCCGSDFTDHHGVVLVWDDPSRPADPPRAVDMPDSPEGVLPEQGTWYQRDDGRIWMYLRDASISCRLALSWSDDEGDTWSEPLRTDFQNTYSRAFAGRLTDCRYFIAGNNFDRLLDRMHLLIALSDDGCVFDRQYTLLKGQTTRRIEGRHKEDGYHYPNCLVDGDRLFVIYSVNKEDIEVGIVDMSQVR